MALLSPWQATFVLPIMKGLSAALLGTTPGEVYKLIMKKHSVVKLFIIECIFKN